MLLFNKIVDYIIGILVCGLVKSFGNNVVLTHYPIILCKLNVRISTLWHAERRPEALVHMHVKITDGS